MVKPLFVLIHMLVAPAEVARALWKLAAQPGLRLKEAKA